MKWQQEEIEEEVQLCPYRPRSKTENYYNPVHDQNKVKPIGTRIYTSFEQCIGSVCMAYDKKNNTCKRNK